MDRLHRSTGFSGTLYRGRRPKMVFSQFVFLYSTFLEEVRANWGSDEPSVRTNPSECNMVQSFELIALCVIMLIQNN